MPILWQNSVVKVAVESKTAAASAGDDIFWRKIAAMINTKIDEKRSAPWRTRFQVQMDLGGNRG
jgi:hypothetical protein